MIQYAVISFLLAIAYCLGNYMYAVAAKKDGLISKLIALFVIASTWISIIQNVIVTNNVADKLGNFYPIFYSASGYIFGIVLGGVITDLIDKRVKL